MCLRCEPDSFSADSGVDGQITGDKDADESQKSSVVPGNQTPAVIGRKRARNDEITLNIKSFFYNAYRLVFSNSPFDQPDTKKCCFCCR